MRSIYRSLVLAAAAVFTLTAAAGAQSLLPKGKVPKDAVITLTRTVCYGTCPAYTVTVDAKGAVAFKGENFTKTKSAKARIAAAKVRDIIKRFEAADFLKLKDSYNSEDYCEPIMTDVPSEVISITSGGISRSVNHYFGCTGATVQPELKRLSELGRYIDETVNTKRWIGERQKLR